MPLVIALAEEIRRKGGTIKEFFLAYLESGTESIDQNLSYMEQMILERKKRETEASTDSLETSASSQNNESPEQGLSLIHISEPTRPY